MAMDNSINWDATQNRDGAPKSGRPGHVYRLVGGVVLGDYKILHPLGAGGMGEVYLAENRVNGRRVALKLLPPDASGPAFIERFRIESGVMMGLEHPRIVRVHHAGEDAGRFYLTMDYIDGPEGQPQRLEDELRSSASGAPGLTEARVRELALEICDALAHAHAKGVVHRDLKPANILLDGDGHVRVADFGLAKVVGDDFVSGMIERSISLSMGASIGGRDTVAGSEGRARYEGTSTGAILGTYDYMSPEQKVDGDVGTQSDIYSFGVILYRLLTGRKPEGRAKPVSHFGVAKHWDAVVDKCLEVDLVERYADMSEVRQAITATARRRSRAPFVTCALLAVVAAVSGWLYVQRPVPPAVDLKPLPDVATESIPAPVSPPLSAVPAEPAVSVPLAVSLEVRPAGARLTVFGRQGLLLQTNLAAALSRLSLASGT
ncbi:MAG: serine/threonine protein kinase, partial [Planctomycetota bacterium]